MCLVAQSCSTLVTPWTVAYRALLSLRFPRQEFWNGLSFPSPGDLLNPGIDPSLLHWKAGSLPLHHLGSPASMYVHLSTLNWREPKESYLVNLERQGLSLTLTVQQKNLTILFKLAYFCWSLYCHKFLSLSPCQGEKYIYIYRERERVHFIKSNKLGNWYRENEKKWKVIWINYTFFHLFH